MYTIEALGFCQVQSHLYLKQINMNLYTFDNEWNAIDLLRFFNFNIRCAGGKCIGSKSPCVTAISHQMPAKNSHDKIKLNANTISVHLHCESTNVVKISCKNRILRREIFF